MVDVYDFVMIETRSVFNIIVQQQTNALKFL